MGEVKVLVLESSTSSAKAMVYSSVSGVLNVKTKTYVSTLEDITKNDARDVFDQTMALGREVAKGHHIDAVALCSCWHSVMLADDDGIPVTPIYHWSNIEPSDLCRELRKDQSYTEDYYHRTGCMVSAIYPFFKLKLFAQEGYDLSKYRIMGQGSYNQFRLTGKFEVTDCMLSGSGLINVHTKQPDETDLKELGIKKSQIGRVITYDQTSPLTPEGAKILGLEPGIPVIGACSDGGLNQVGAGAIQDGVMTFSVGTSGAIRLSTSEPVLPHHPATWCYLSPVGFLSGAATSGCCNCIDWAKEKLFSHQVSYQEAEQGYTEKETSPIFLPFIYGERCPGWQDERGGGFFDVRGIHDTYDLYHSVQEGVLFNLYHCYRILTEKNGTPSKIMLSGGILKSDRWSQMCADIFGETMDIANLDQASLLGGAVLGLYILGEIPDVKSFDCETVRQIHPNLEKKAFYEHQFDRYLDWYHKTVS
ncbi:MAG: FGGY-family carbohydrate kinase [Lachnospiraceae bacterium]|nr:FGGY-family carbohydrate kinase [Lachnospiraceae bacterium]